MLCHTEQEILNIIITEPKDYISFGFFFVLLLTLFICFWLLWVFGAARGLL